MLVTLAMRLNSRREGLRHGVLGGHCAQAWVPLFTSGLVLARHGSLRPAISVLVLIDLSCLGLACGVGILMDMLFHSQGIRLLPRLRCIAKAGGHGGILSRCFKLEHLLLLRRQPALLRDDVTADGLCQCVCLQ